MSRPFDSTTSALQPVMKALVRNELLRHINEDVKVSVVSCLTEISRIYAPKYPYDDHKQMEIELYHSNLSFCFYFNVFSFYKPGQFLCQEILRQTVMTLKKLADVTSRSYRKGV
uniref:Uncharacterized protein n=1 Tax=Solanum tuberosum TaxID=4113 RepID=M1CRU1_SOLTU